MNRVAQASRWLGRRVRELRIGLGLSQEEAAFRADIDPKHLQAIEAGQSNPTLATLLGVARALSVSMSTLFTGIEEKRGGRLSPGDTTRAGQLRNALSSDNIRYVSLGRVAERAARRELWMLNEKEQAVFDLLVLEGLEDREIAERLDITERNAKFYVVSIRRKMGAANRLKLAVAYWTGRLDALEHTQRTQRKIAKKK